MRYESRLTRDEPRDFARFREIVRDYVSFDVSLTHGANTPNYTISRLHKNNSDCAEAKQIVLSQCRFRLDSDIAYRCVHADEHPDRVEFAGVQAFHVYGNGEKHTADPRADRH